MSIAEFINDIAAQGVYLSVVEGKLKSRAEKGKLTDEIRSQIKTRRAEVMEYFLAAQNKGQVQIAKRPQGADTLASFAQQRLWFVDKLEGGSAQYNIPSAFIIEGELNLDALKAALQQICNRHEVLRTVFEQRNGEVYQRPLAQASLDIQTIDLSADPEQQRKLTQLAVDDATKPFDLAQDLLLRATVVKLNELRHGILLNMHHIAADGWSVNIFIKEFCQLYASKTPLHLLPELPVQYADYSHWQRTNMTSDSYAKKLDYWLERLNDLPQVHNLPLDKKRPLRQSVNGAMVHKDFELSSSEKLNDFCKAHDVTPFMLLQTAFALLVGRYSNERDVVMGSPSAGRMNQDLEPLIGFFINMLVLRTEMDEAQSFADLLGQNKQHILNAFSHQEVAFDQLVEKLNPQRVLSYNPLIQILFSLHNNEKSELDIAGLKLSPLGEDVAQSQYDIELNISEKQGQFSCSWRYNTDLFEHASVASMAQNFVTLVEQVIVNPDTIVGQIDVVDSAEKELLLNFGGVYQLQSQPQQSFLSQFEGIAAAQPELIACQCDGETLSYGELNAKANQIARFLQRADAGVGTLVGLYVNRGIELMLGVLGALKSGAGYVPLDPSLPFERIEYMIEDSEIAVVLTESDYIEELSFDELTLLPVDERMLNLMVSRFEQDNLSAEQNKLTGQSTAYVIYTSGSTGKPKGVEVSHQNLQHYLAHAKDTYTAQSNNALVSTGIGFDATVTSLLTPLVCGGTVELIANSLDEMSSLSQVIKQASQAKLFKLTPAHLNALQYYLKGFSSDLAHCLVVGGEKLALPTAQQWLQQFLPNATLINEYGPTEATVGCTYAKVTLDDCKEIDGQFASIGKPINDTAILLLDEQQQLVPVGVIGEIYIGGAGVALGYRNQRALTEKYFIDVPSEFSLTGKLYRTGDLARWTKAGQLEFIDRVDEQIKVRGYRIELGEIENQLQSLAQVNGAVVDVCQDDHGDNRLVAYVICELDDFEEEVEDTAITAKLRAQLMSKLPDYMVPDIFLLINKIPLTANGKVDRNALPKPDGDLLVQAQAYLAPKTQTHHQLVSIWANLLSLDEQSIGINTSFFDLGGHSLLVIRFVSEVREAFTQELEVKEVFDSPTISELAAVLEQRQQDDSAQNVRPKVTAQANDVETIPLSYAQQRLWFIDRLDGGSAQFNMPLAFTVKGALNPEQVERAFAAIVARHQVLRTVLVEVDGIPIQQVIDNAEFKLRRKDFSHLSPTQRQHEVLAEIEHDRTACFDLSQDLMLRASYILLGGTGSEQSGVLLFNMHHIASDGWSKGVLVNEFMQCYQAQVNGQEAQLPELAIQYADYALWQRQWLDQTQLQSQLDYWSQNLLGAPMLHELEPDLPRPAKKHHTGNVHSSQLSGDIAVKLQQLAGQYQLTPFMLLHGVFALLLSRHSNSHDIVIGTPVANRLQSELEALIGFFVNTLVLRVNTEHQDLTEYFAHVREVHLAAQSNQDVPFEQLVEHCNVPRNPSFTPLYQIMFTVNTNEQKPLALEGLSFAAFDNEQEAVKGDLDVNARINDDGVLFSWVYDEQLFTQERISMLAEHFNRMLEGLVNGVSEVPGRIPMLSDEQTDNLLNLGFAEHNEALPCANLHQLVERFAIDSPNSIAVVHFDSEGRKCELNYRQFNAKANQLAGLLIEQGVVLGSPVGLMMDRDLQVLIAMLAISKAGGAYVPIDHKMPTARLSHIVNDTQMQLLLSHSGFADIVDGLNVQPIEVDNFFSSNGVDDYSSENLNLNIAAEQLAYIIYTSGTTGQPKGVLVNHQSAVNALSESAKLYSYEQNSINLSLMAVSFDAGSLSIWSTFVQGSSLHIVDPLQLSAVALQQYINDNKISHLISTPALVADIDPAALTTLKFLGLGGEQISTAKLEDWTANCRLFNCYGPTESCMFSITQELLSGEEILLGKPIANTRIYVLDDNLQVVPPGAAGMLYIGGMGLARGYLNQPELTAQKFIQNPFEPQSEGKIYNTGDLVRVGPQGQLRFIGRNDEQVKVRGLRIELGEIISQLNNCENVASGAVVLDDEKRIAAYVVATNPVEDEALFFNAIKAQLSSYLPQYMVPTAWLCLTQLPLTLNGKVDVAKLPKIAKQRRFRQAQNPSQQILCQLWQDLLAVEKVGLDDNFFELGGHSLLMVRLISDIRSELSVELPLRSIFEHPTVEALAEYIDGQNQAGNIVDTLPPIEKVSREQPLPLSHSQQRLWFIDKLEGSSSHYNMPSAFVLKGPLHIAAFEQTLKTIIERHEVLRTNLIEHQGVASQVITEHFEVPLKQVDLTTLPSDERNLKTDELMKADAIAPFSLEQDLMIRVTLLKLDEDDHSVLFNMHHIASDGWSMGLLVGEFSQLYRAFVHGRANPLAPLAIQFADFAIWQRQQLSESQLATQMQYWREQLAEVKPLHSLPSIGPRPAEQDFDGRRYAQRLNNDLTVKIQDFCAKTDVSTFMFVQTCMSIVFARYSNEHDIVIGSPIAGRPYREVEQLIGFFLNTLVLRSDLSKNQPFAAQLAQNKGMILDAYSHQLVPFEMLVEQLSPERSLSYNPMVQVLLNVFETVSSSDLDLSDLEVSKLEAMGEQNISLPKADMIIYVRPNNGGLSIQWDHRTSIFSERIIAQMAQSLEYVIEQVIDSPELGIFDLQLTDTSGQNELLEAYYQPVAPSHAQPLMLAMFQRSVDEYGDDTALVHQFNSLTFDELDQQTNQLALHLVENGLVKGDTVGLLCYRGIELYVGVLATLKAGGVFVPLMPQLPDERISYILTDADIRWVLTEQELASKVSADIKSVLLDESLPETASKATALPTLSPEDGSHIIYTSGSTGQPKGVLGTHGSLANRIGWMDKAFPFDAEEDVACQITSSGFIRAVWEMLTPLAFGVQVVVLDTDDVKDAHKFIDKMSLHSITRVVSAPSFANAIVSMDSDQLELLCELRYWFISGEPLKPALANQLIETLEETTFVNLYGSTEVMSDVSFYVVEQHVEGLRVPIGQAIDNTNLLILDKGQQLVPVGVPGEICIEGHALAQEYLNNPQMTAQKFATITLAEEPHRVYRTGDMGVMNKDGNIECLGRQDNQLKLRGYRIELEEIESQLTHFDGIKQAVVLLHGRDEKNDNEGYLVAHVLVDSSRLDETSATVIENQCRDYLIEHLPDYMMPSRINVLSRYPLLHNGKVDRKLLLKDFENNGDGNQYCAPTNPVETQLSQIWQAVLQREKIGINDDFFALGGHSLLAIRLISRIRQAFDVELTPRVLFEYPTIAQLAKAMFDEQYSATITPIVALPKGTEVPLSFAQQRLWFINSLEAQSAQYNMPKAFAIEGDFDLSACQRALAALVARHDILRTRFIENAGQVLQVVDDKFAPTLVQQDLTDEADPQAKAQQLIKAHAAKCFDLAGEPLLDMRLIKLSADTHVMLFNMHHIASDGWSMGILSDEFSLLYQAFSQGQPNPLEPLTIQYADYANWQRDWMSGEALEAQLQFWRTQLHQLPQLHKLPLDNTRPQHNAYHGGQRRQSIDGERYQRVAAFCQSNQVTMFMMMHSVLSVLFSRYSNENDIVIGTPVAGRPLKELEPIVGLFVNTLVLRSQINPQAGFAALLENNKKMILDAYQHQFLPFEALVEDLKPERHINYNPLFQIMFSMHNSQGSDDASDLQMRNVGSNNGTSKFDLSIDMEERDGQVLIEWGFDLALFLPESIEQMSENFLVLLDDALQRPEQSVACLNLLTEQSTTRQLQQFNGAEVNYPGAKTLTQRFSQALARFGEATAVVHNEASMSYEQLDELSNRLAQYLKAQGVVANTLVGIYAYRSPAVLTAMLAVLKAGGAFVPIDPINPRQRIDYMLSDSQINILLSESSLIAGLDLGPELEVFAMDDFAQSLSEYSPAPLDCINDESDAAYMIYTSGSTGQPKGALVHHSGAINHIDGEFDIMGFMDDGLQLKPLNFLQSAAASSDISVWQFLAPVMSGGKTVILDDMTDMTALCHQVSTHKVDIIELVPVIIARLLDHLQSPSVDKGVMECLSWLMITGDATPVGMVNRWFELFPHVPVMNGYGPTEASDDISYHIIEQPLPIDCHNIPIGKPLANLSLYVLNERMQLQPLGAVGEICVSGVGVGKGYWGKPEKTAEVFVDNPYAQHQGHGQTLYRTGDLGRWLPNGELQMMGRIDNQVKVRGFRIELGEIEAALADLSYVNDAAVIICQDQQNEDFLAAYLSASANSSIDIRQLRKQLADKLPGYMVPATFTVLAKMPLNSTGKIDRLALPKPEQEAQVAYRAPETDTQRKLCDIWQQVLQKDQIGIDDNFFEIGGHSLQMLEISGLLNAAEIAVDVMDFYRYQSIADLAEYVDDDQTEHAGDGSGFFMTTSQADKIVFALHPQGGHVASMMSLAKGLAPYCRVYGLEAPDLHSDRQSKAIEDLVEYHLQQILKVQPNGPFYLTGWSSGGKLAYDIANRLRLLGHEIANLSILDTSPNLPLSQDKIAQITWFEPVIAMLDERLAVETTVLDGMSPEQGIDYLVEQSISQGLCPVEEKTRAFRTIRYLHNIDNAFNLYRSVHCDVDIDLYRLDKPTSIHDSDKVNELADYGWSDFTSGEVTVIAAEGSHSTMLNAPYVDSLLATMITKLTD